MRPIKVTYSPITASTTGLANQVTSTGAALTLTATAPTDGLAHIISLTSAGGVDLSGVAFTVTGKDADGNAQTDTIAAGPNGTTVATTKYFKSDITVTPSATMATKLMDVGWTAASLSPAIPLDRRSISAAALTVQVTGTINYTVNDTIGDVFAYYPTAVPWTAITALSAKAVTTDGSARVAATAVQVLTNTVTNGATYTLWISQASQVTG